MLDPWIIEEIRRREEEQRQREEERRPRLEIHIETPSHSDHSDSRRERARRPDPAVPGEERGVAIIDFGVG